MPRLPIVFQVPQLVGFPCELTLFPKWGSVEKLDDVCEEGGIYAIAFGQSSSTETAYCDLEEGAGYGSKIVSENTI